MLEAFRILEEDKGIKKEDIIDAVVESLRSAYRRRYGQSDSVAIDFNEKTGDFTVYTVREVVDEVFDSRLEISLKDDHGKNAQANTCHHLQYLQRT